jgi:hypothetical protein
MREALAAQRRHQFLRASSQTRDIAVNGFWSNAVLYTTDCLASYARASPT